MKTRRVQGGPRSSNQRWSDPSIHRPAGHCQGQCPERLDQLTIALPAQARLVKRAALLAGQPYPGVLHPLAQRLTGHLQPMFFAQLLCRQRRTEIGVVFLDQRHGKSSNRRIDPVVRSPAARLVPDRRRALGPEPLQQPMNLPPTQSQQVRRSLRRHPTLYDLAQNLDPVQLALAHDHQSHGHTPFPSRRGSVTLLLCKCGTV